MRCKSDPSHCVPKSVLQCVCCSNVCYPLHDSLRQRVQKAQWNSRDNNRATFNPGQRKHANVCENVSLSDVSCSPPAHGTQTRGIVQQGDTPQMFSFISNVHGLPKQLCTNNTVPGGERRRLALHSHIIRSGEGLRSRWCRWMQSFSTGNCLCCGG